MSQTTVLIITLVAMCAPWFGYFLGWLVDPKGLLYKTAATVCVIWYVCWHLEEQMASLITYAYIVEGSPQKRVD